MHGVLQFGAPGEQEVVGAANSVNVGVRCGSAVTMWSVFISTGSASAAVMFSFTPVYGFVAVQGADPAAEGSA